MPPHLSFSKPFLPVVPPIAFSLNVFSEIRGHQAFSLKSQSVNILGFVGHNVNEWVRVCSNKTLFAKTESPLDLPMDLALDVGIMHFFNMCIFIYECLYLSF